MKILYSIFIYFLFSLTLLAQLKEDNIATVGDKKISARQFQMRYELMPHLDNDPYLKDSAKNHFLYTLIAEKLWADEAERLGLDNSPYMLNTMKPLKNLYLRDALYKQEIENKIKITPEEIIRANSRKDITVKFNAISSIDSSEIYKIYSDLKKGASFDSLLRHRAEFAEPEKPLEGSFGQFDDEAVEDTLYGLKIGKYSSPVKTYYGWFIFRLKDKIKKGNSGQEESLKSVSRILKEMKAGKLGTEYLQHIMSNVKATIDSALFYNLAEKFFIILKNKKNNNNDTSLIFIDAPDIFKIVRELGSDTLKMQLVHNSEISITVSDFLYNMLIDQFYLKEPDWDSITLILNRSIKNFIQENYLNREAIIKGLQNLPDVRNELDMWKENHLAQLMKNRFRDSVIVTDNEISNYLSKNYKKDLPITEVNILEILNDNLEVMEHVLNQLKYGTDFRDLARLYTKRIWTKNKGGEFGFFPSTMYGDIGRIAAKMKIGEVYGPISTSDGYSIFKLIGKKEINTSSETTLEQYKEHAINEIKERKLDSLLDSYTAKLANKYGIKINTKVLNSLKITNLNMFTYRYMGFGGRIAAVPYTASFYNWVKEWKKQKSSLP